MARRGGGLEPVDHPAHCEAVRRIQIARVDSREEQELETAPQRDDLQPDEAARRRVVTLRPHDGRDEVGPLRSLPPEEDVTLALLPHSDAEPLEIEAEIAVVGAVGQIAPRSDERSEEHTSELQSLMRNSYAVFCLKK